MQKKIDIEILGLDFEKVVQVIFELADFWIANKKNFRKKTCVHRLCPELHELTTVNENQSCNISSVKKTTQESYISSRVIECGSLERGQLLKIVNC